MTDGALIILFYLVINVVAAFIETGAASGGFTDSCTSSQNVTTCESAGRESFFEAVADVSVSGFTGAPVIVNVLWLLIGVFLISLAILNIVLAFTPTTSE